MRGRARQEMNGGMNERESRREGGLRSKIDRDVGPCSSTLPTCIPTC